MVTAADRQPPAGDWRQGAAAVAVLSFDVDAEAPILAEGDYHAEDLSTMSHQAYGPRVGIPRILELLAAHELGATLFVPDITAERWSSTHAGMASSFLRLPHPPRAPTSGPPKE